MSGVYARNKKKTGFAPVDNGGELYDIIPGYVMNEKYVPKRWRLSLGLALIQKSDELMDNIFQANETPLIKGNERYRSIRREYWRRAAANCKQMDRQLNRMQKNIPTATADSMRDIIELLEATASAISVRRERE